MEFQLNNLINKETSTVFINSNDTVKGLKNLIALSLKSNKITESNLLLSYLDPNTKQMIYMLSPYRTILSYNGIMDSKQIYIEKRGIQLDSALAIILENFLPVLTFYFLYKNQFYYTKLLIHNIVFLLTCLYFICRLFICLKFYNNGNYLLSQLIINLVIYWFLYSIICGNSIFNDDLDNMSIYGYLFTIVFIFCAILCVKLVKEHKDNEIVKNILFKYVKYPYYTLDCILWISMMIIVYNKKIFIFTVIKILYNIYLAFAEYIEEKGLEKYNSNINNNNLDNNYNNNFQDNKNNIKVIFPFLL